MSVIVPTLGRGTLEQCRAALESQTRRPDEVIVVHDPDRRGSSWARNEGVRRSAGDLIAFVDDDCVPAPDWLESLVRAVDAWKADGAGGSYVETDPLLIAARSRRPLPAETCRDPGGLVGVGGNVLYRRAWIDRVAREDGHVFNESFRTGEDWELAWRLRRRGAALVFVPGTVTHLRRARPWQHCRQQFARGVGIAQLYLAHRAAGSHVAAQESRIWGLQTSWLRGFLAAAWHKLVGPFDVARFERRRDFWLSWLGEKAQAAGFAWGMATRVRWGTAVKLLISLGILALILHQVSFAAIGNAFAGADPALLLLGVAPLPLIAWLAARQMKVIADLQGLAISTREIVEVNLATNFYALFLPGAIAGGAVRWYKLATPGGKPAEALAAIVYNRLVDTFAVLALGLGFWAADPVGRAHPAVAVVSLVFLLGLAILHLLLFDRRAAALAGRWLGAGSRFVPRRIVAALGALPAAAARFGDLPARGRAQVVLLCLARQLVGVVSLFCFARALHLPLSIVNAGWVRSLVLLVAMLPISFAGLGVREGTLIAALQPYGIGAAAAVALALVMFARDLVGAAAGGVLEARRLFAGPNVEAAQ